TFHDTTKYVYENAFNFWIGQDDFECFSNFLSRCIAPNIKEVSWVSTFIFDDVHSRHSKTCTVNHAADVPVKLDITQVIFGRLDFIFFLFLKITRSEEHTSELQ